MAQLMKEWVLSCEQGRRDSRINRRLTLANPNEHITASEGAMQIDLVPGQPPSGGYENLVTATDMLSRYFFCISDI